MIPKLQDAYKECAENITVEVCGKFKVIPIKAETGSVGYDIALPESEGSVLMPYMSQRKIDTGILFKVPEKCWILLVPRSSSCKKGVRISNTVGVIDPSYCGPNDHLKVFLTRDPKNSRFLGKVSYSDWDTPNKVRLWCMESNVLHQNLITIQDDQARCYHIYEQTPDVFEVFEPGERFCQVLFLPYYRADLLEKTIKEWDLANDRGGFGSTGK